MDRRIVALAALALALLTGCSASDSAGGGEGAVPSLGSGREDLGVDGGGPGSEDPAGEAEVPVVGDRHVVVEGELVLVVPSPVEAADEAVTIVERAGGYASARTEHSAEEGWGGSAELVLRIPAERLEATLAELEGLGTLVSRRSDATDVSLQVADLTGRVTALRTSVDRLLEMLASAEKTADLVAVEDVLQQRQAELESLESQLRVMRDRVALATFTVHLEAPGSPLERAPASFLDGVEEGWESLVDAIRSATVAAGVALPWLVFLALVGTVVLGLVRLTGRRRRGGTGPTPPPSGTSPGPEVREG